MLQRVLGAVLAASLCVALAAGSGIATPARAAEGFLSVAEDVPLMPGLVEDAGSATVFDKPEGRIVQADAVGAVRRAAVLAFYAETLPQLGWAPGPAPAEFSREREMLRLSFKGRDGALTVHFDLTPR